MIINTAIFENYELAKENIRLGVRKVTDDNVVKEPFLDLEMYVYVKLDGGIAKVNERVINMWQTNKEDVFAVARENTLPELKVESMREIIEKQFGMSLPDDTPDQIVLKNDDAYLGGAALCFNEILAKAAEKANADTLVVIPSSIHEIICLPYNGENVYDLNDMVRTVNASEVAPEEQLADHVYFFAEGKVFKP